jgi:hypothetical protein
MQNNSLNTEIHALQERIKAKDEMLSQKDEMILELRQDRDLWRQQAQQLLLTSNTERKSFWQRVFGV